jgi:hypothetical protein
MQRIRRRYLIGGVTVVCVAAAIFGATSSTFGGGGSAKSAGGLTPVTFSKVTPQQLSAGGIQLTSPEGTSPADAGQAAAAASKSFGAPALESHFAHCVDTNASPSIDEDCWAVALDVSHLDLVGGTPPGGPPAKPLTYLVVLVDPATDKILEAQGSRS